MGLAIGYLSRGSRSSVSSVQPAVGPATTVSQGGAANGHVPTLGEMKQAADTQAAPLLGKLKSNPKDSALLAQVGALYHTSHQFSEAATYYGKAVEADPRNVAVRTRYASSLYRSGDVDGAIAQLNQALRYDPKDANSLFDLGMIRLQGKGDGKGALAAWQQLLKSNPQLSPDRKATVQRLMADVLTSLSQGQRNGNDNSGAQGRPEHRDQAPQG
jgi:cytochrome c-type biogenesis protein CcmH/NrfG